VLLRAEESGARLVPRPLDGLDLSLAAADWHRVLRWAVELELAEVLSDVKLGVRVRADVV